MIGIKTLPGLNDWLSDQLILLFEKAGGTTAAFAIVVSPYETIHRFKYDIIGHPVNIIAHPANEEELLRSNFGTRSDLDRALVLAETLAKALALLDVPETSISIHDFSNGDPQP